MKKISLLFVLLLIGCIGVHAKAPKDISIIRLLSTPEKYIGQSIRVEGFLHVKFEDSALYLTKDHADRLASSYAIWVDYSKNRSLNLEPSNRNGIDYFDCKWVLLEGTFQFNADGSHGHFGVFAAEIVDVTRVMELTQWYNGKQELKR